MDEKVERVKSVLCSWLNREEFSLFEEADIQNLARNGFLNAAAFASTDRENLRNVLPQRAALVGVLLKAFVRSTDDDSEKKRQKKRQKSELGALIGGSTYTVSSCRDNKRKILLHFYRESLVEARKVLGMPDRRRQECPLPLNKDRTLYVDFGAYFTIKGRTETIEHLIAGGARIFQTFMNESSSLDELERKDFLMMLVGFPGVGKTTTAQNCLSALMKEFWYRESQKVDALLLEQLGSQSLVSQFKQMIENSRGFHYRMYHSIESSGRDGQILFEEDGLGPDALLAVRCLHAAVSPVDGSSYCSFLKALDGKVPGLKHALEFQDVVDFIREGLDILEEKRIILAWFFDEANKAAEWLQGMLSSYVQWMKEHRGGSTFSVVAVATTKFSGATLVGSASGKAQSVYVPLRPLTDSEAFEVTKLFLQRVVNMVQPGHTVELSNSLKILVQIAGGNPRMLSFLLKGLCTSGASIVPDTLASIVLHQDEVLRHDKMTETLENAWRFIAPQYYTGFLDKDKERLILRALQVSLLGIWVQRGSKIWEDEYPNDLWGHLEGQGLVGLVPKREAVLHSSTSINHLDVQVVFSPMIFYYLVIQDMGGLKRLRPLVESNDWCQREGTDLCYLLFMICLQLQVQDGTFMLNNILPVHTFIPQNLAGLKFQVPHGVSWEIKQSKMQIQSRQAFSKFMAANKGSFAFLGVGNHKADSWMRLLEVSSGQPRTFYIFLESKFRREKDKATVSYSAIKAKVKKNVCSWINLENNNAINIYNSDQKITKALGEHKMQFNNSALTRSLVIWDGYPAVSSPLSLLSALSHIAQYAKASI